MGKTVYLKPEDLEPQGLPPMVLCGGIKRPYRAGGPVSPDLASLIASGALAPKPSSDSEPMPRAP